MVNKVVELKMEHVLILVIVTFVLYHFMGRCSCGNGFRIGGRDEPFVHKLHRYMPWLPCPFDDCR